MKDNLSNIVNLLPVMTAHGGNAEAFEKLVSLWLVLTSKGNLLYRLFNHCWIQKDKGEPSWTFRY
jgi:hypothetical protein